MGKVIGIDLGTTNSCVAVMEGGEPVIIPNAEGERTTPSVVAFSKNGERLTGAVARRQAATNVDRTISSIKREIGTNYRVKIDRKNYSPQEISAFILMKMKKDAESYLGESVNEAVITVPAYFNDAQRQATKDAGRIAGLDVLRIINEPTSAALAYGLDHGQAQKIMVYDLGGGTFDVSLIEIGDNLIEVLATAGDNHLGGDDFDVRLADYIVEQYKKQEKVNLIKDSVAMQRVREAAEEAKKNLSAQSLASINLPFITTVKGEPKHLEMEISRATFDSLTKDLVERTEGPVRKVLDDAGVATSQLGMVLLVGGSTRIPAVHEKVSQMTGKMPSKNLNPDECVALGAAIQGAKLSGELSIGNALELILMDVTPLSLSIETVGGVATKIIDRNTTIPNRHSQVFSTAGNFQTSVEIKVLQGERQFAKDNTLLGNFRLNGIKRAPAGVPQIEVTFDIDANGIVNVSAKDLGTGKEQSITITASSNLSEDEIQKAIRDAASNESEDSHKMEQLDILGEAQKQMINAQQFLSDNKKTLDKDKKREIKSQIAAVQKAVRFKKPEKLTDDEVEVIKTQTENLKNMI
ncbi:MAG TPA: molecular chaperone DnaK [Candidatus Pelethocola excrementipullorum]|nr:molecular chaperone DnaK [Candidatus Pelethocola excrementipullorum]